MSVVPADPADLPSIRELLSVAGLPTDDLMEIGASRHFLVLRMDGQIRGAVGLELHRDVALLRSLVVTPESRGQGFGAVLTASAESLGGQLGIASIYLLTTTATRFFESQGYRRIDRADAPASIRATTQFNALCPSTAVLMVKQ